MMMLGKIIDNGCCSISRIVVDNNHLSGFQLLIDQRLKGFSNVLLLVVCRYDNVNFQDLCVNFFGINDIVSGSKIPQ